ncbi:MAG: 4Fe-4S dicluster domain-containing protein, partial [Candidatus Thorarchaeota archaeon]
LGLYAGIGKYMSKKLFANISCTQCQVCIKECPNQNISLVDNQIIFDNRCIFCLRCINNCPEESIQIGKLSYGKARWHGPKNNYKALRYKTPEDFY